MEFFTAKFDEILILYKKNWESILTSSFLQMNDKIFEQISKFENLVLKGHFLGMAHIPPIYVLSRVSDSVTN